MHGLDSYFPDEFYPLDTIMSKLSPSTRILHILIHTPTQPTTNFTESFCSHLVSLYSKFSFLW